MSTCFLCFFFVWCIDMLLWSVSTERMKFLVCVRFPRFEELFISWFRFISVPLHFQNG